MKITQIMLEAPDIMPHAIWALSGVVVTLAACIVYMGKRKPENGTNGHPLSAKQELQIRKIIEEMVIKQGQAGGLHDLKNKLTELIWRMKELELPENRDRKN